jgi:hypothetical protein
MGLGSWFIHMHFIRSTQSPLNVDFLRYQPPFFSTAIL